MESEMSDQQRKQLEALLFSESDDEIIVQADGSCLNITQRIAAAVEAEGQKWQKAVHTAEATMRAAVNASDKAHEDAAIAVEAERKACNLRLDELRATWFRRACQMVKGERKACEEIARKWLKTEDDCGERGYSGHIADDIAARWEGEGSSQNEQD